MIVTTSFGGLAAARGTQGWLIAHIAAVWITAVYNWRVLFKEAIGVRANSLLIEEVNRAALLVKPLAHSEDTSNEVLPGAIENLSWGVHVYALGKFLVFLGYNTWLPYLYFRYIMGLLTTPFLPFFAVSAIFFAGGYYLRFRYRRFRPGGGPLTA